MVCAATALVVAPAACASEEAVTPAGSASPSVSNSAAPSDGTLASTNGATFLTSQALGFNPDAYQETDIGYITALTIDTTTLTPDLPIDYNANPPNPQPIPNAKPGEPTVFNVVGVLSQLYFSGSEASSQFVTVAAVSQANQQILSNLAQNGAADPQVSINAAVYGVNSAKIAYYPAFLAAGGQGLASTVPVQGGTLAFQVDTSPVASLSSAVLYPVYNVILGLAPPPGCSNYTTQATATSEPVTHPWGMGC